MRQLPSGVLCAAVLVAACTAGGSPASPEAVPLPPAPAPTPTEVTEAAVSTPTPTVAPTSTTAAPTADATRTATPPPAPATPTGVPATATPEAPPPPPSLRLVASLPDTGRGLGDEFATSDLAFWGDRAVVGSYDGFRVVDITDPAAPAVVAEVTCRTVQGDVSVWENLVFLSSDRPVVGPGCEGQDTTADAFGAFEGIRVFDLTDVAAPRLVASVPTACGSHTHTLLPDLENGRVLLYAPSYAPTVGSIGPGCDNPHALLSVVEVPLAAPESARVVAEPALDVPTHEFPPGSDLVATAGCHDIQVFAELALAAAACMSEGQLWDLSDPLAPRVTHRLDVLEVEFWHSAAFSWDGEVVVFADESFAGPLGCADPTLGALWFYRVEDPSQPLAQLGVPRTQGDAWPCSFHNLAVVPTPERDVLVASAYTAGVSVVDFTDPAAPAEIAFFDAPEGEPSDSWSAYWYDGHVYATDHGTRGLDVLAVEPAFAGTVAVDHLNPQTQAGLLSGG